MRPSGFCESKSYPPKSGYKVSLVKRSPAFERGFLMFRQNVIFQIFLCRNGSEPSPLMALLTPPSITGKEPGCTTMEA